MKTVQITVKVSPRIVERADELVPFVSEDQGRDVTRADVYRHALSLGLSVIARRRRERTGEGGPVAEDDEA